MTSPTRPNVIVFFTDQQRWDCSGLHGNPLELMPNFDRMALAGTHVANSFTCQPVCGPARSCLQTGLYGTTTGCFHNGVPLPQGSETLAHYFREAGYKTGYIGKWHLADDHIAGPVKEEERGGYEEWLASNILEFTSDAYDLVMYNNDGEAVKLPGYRVDGQTDAAIRFLDCHQTDPFFLFLSYIEPHHQNHRDDYPAPEGYADRYRGKWMPPDLAALGGSAHRDVAGYYGMVKRLDEALGRILDALKSLGQDKNTIILFTSDHGCHFKTRNAEYKRSCHESSIRVPTAWAGPGFFGGGKIDQLVSLIDLPPTLLDAAGIEVPESMQGRSMMPLIHEKEPEWPEEVFVQISETEIGRAIRTHRWKYEVVGTQGDPVHDPGAEEYAETSLYDLMADPYELTNLVGLNSHRHVADVLQQRLLRRIEQAGEKKPFIHSAPSRDGGQRKASHEEALM
ncbi:sulfatase [soil metagenome]